MIIVKHRAAAHASLLKCSSWTRCTHASRRAITTLAIESSCDDTCVSVIEKHNDNLTPRSSRARILYHKRITANNLAHRGIHPLTSLQSHEANLAHLVQDAATHIPGDSAGRQKPDFVSVTRGPGMRSSLNTGLNTAKGLALAWDIPLLAVHHMQAHALTPRLVSALDDTSSSIKPKSAPSMQPGIPPGDDLAPAFPFLTLLVSGGHTLLLHSRSLTAHPILATTTDIAIGDCIDKIARDVLPEAVLASAKSTMYGPVLEDFAFPSLRRITGSTAPSAAKYGYEAPSDRKAELSRRDTAFGWSFTPPLSETRMGQKRSSLEFSFTGLTSAAKRVAEARTREGAFHEEERRVMAREAMRVAFEHLASRVVLALDGMRGCGDDEVGALIVSGGVAANSFLRAL